MFKKKVLGIPILAVIAVVVVMALFGGAVLGAFIYTKTQSGSVTVNPRGDIAVTVNMVFGTVTCGDNVSKSISITNESTAPIVLTYGNLVSDTETIADVSWVLDKTTLQPAETATGYAYFVFQDTQSVYGTLRNVTWDVIATTP